MSRHRHVGKHRAPRRPRSLPRRVGTCAGLIACCGLAAATWAPAVSADSPVRTGWWNQASGGGQSAPQPTTPAGGLHLAVASNQIGAFGAVLYELPADATGTLTLGVAHIAATPVVNPTAPSTSPQVAVQACPTKDVNWKAGDDQPWDAAPGYDCSHSVQGTLSRDQKSIVFLVDGSMDIAPGQLSLAIVPTLTDGIPGAGTDAPVGTTQPYSLDTDKPVATSLAVTGGGAAGDVGTNAGGTESASAATATTAAAGSLGTTSAASTIPQPIQGTSTTAVAPGPAPVVAPPTAGAPTPVLAAASGASRSHRARNGALGMLLLIAVSLAAMSNGQAQRAPRLLGGSARRSTAPQETIHRTGGLGRFSRPRTSAPHPLV